MCFIENFTSFLTKRWFLIKKGNLDQLKGEEKREKEASTTTAIDRQVPGPSQNNSKALIGDSYSSTPTSENVSLRKLQN